MLILLRFVLCNSLLFPLLSSTHLHLLQYHFLRMREHYLPAYQVLWWVKVLKVRLLACLFLLHHVKVTVLAVLLFRKQLFLMLLQKLQNVVSFLKPLSVGLRCLKAQVVYVKFLLLFLWRHFLGKYRLYFLRIGSWKFNLFLLAVLQLFVLIFTNFRPLQFQLVLQINQTLRSQFLECHFILLRVRLHTLQLQWKKTLLIFIFLDIITFWIPDLIYLRLNGTVLEYRWQKIVRWKLLSWFVGWSLV